MSDIGPRPAQKPHATQQNTAQNVHARPQKSQTLHRAALKRPAPSSTKSPMITKFAPHPKPLPTIRQDRESTQTATHSVQPTAVSHQAQQGPDKNQLLKERLIKEKLAQVEARKKSTTHTSSKKGRLKSFLARRPRLVSVTTASLALLLLGGYITYINLPNLSVRVAAAHAGIDATYPEYSPDGYHLNGPVAYSPGEVTLNFGSNTNTKLNYALKQRASSWDSQAVLDNYVSKYTPSPNTISSNGLTIYIYGNDNNAAWVNGGILYTISGNALLSTDQIRQIAASM